MPRRSLLALALLVVVGCKKGAPAAEGPRPVTPDGCGAILDEDSCRAEAACTIIDGTPLAPDSSCSMDNRFAACGPADMACGDALTYTHDPDGNAWWFSDTCLPEGWQSEPYPDGMSEAPPPC